MMLLPSRRGCHARGRGYPAVAEARVPAQKLVEACLKLNQIALTPPPRPALWRPNGTRSSVRWMVAVTRLRTTADAHGFKTLWAGQAVLFPAGLVALHAGRLRPCRSARQGRWG